MADIEFVPVEQWVKPCPDNPNDYQLCEPTTGGPYDPSAIPSWAKDALGVRAFRRCASVLRLFVDSPQSEASLDGVQLTDFSEGIEVFGWQSEPHGEEGPIAGKRILATAEELALRTPHGTYFDTSCETSAYDVARELIYAAGEHIAKAHDVHKPYDRAIFLAAGLYVAKAACWNTLAGAGDALLFHDEAASFGRTQTGVAISVRPRMARTIAHAARLLGLPRERVEIEYIDPPAQWSAAERIATHRVTEGLRTGRIRVA